MNSRDTQAEHAAAPSSGSDRAMGGLAACAPGDKLAEERERLRFIMEATRTHFNILDASFNLHYVDPAWQQVYGDPQRRKCYEYFMARDSPCAGCGVLQAIEARESVVCEQFLPRENRTIEVHTIPFQDREGAWRVAEFNIDITDRIHAEEALRVSEARYRLLAEHSADVIFVQNGETGDITYLSPSVEDLMGYEPDEAYSLWLSDVLTPDSYARQTQAREAAHTADIHRSTITEYELLHRDGHIVPVEVHSNVIVDDEGTPVEIVGVARDITGRKQAEAERQRLLAQIREQAQRVQAIIDTVPTGVLLLDAGGRVQLANPVGKEDLAVLAGAPGSGVINHLGQRPLDELLAPPSRGGWHEVEAEGRTFEVIGRPAESNLGSATPAEAHPQHWVVVINDVTEDREVRAQLQHREQLAVVGQLAAGIAHDFNNILGAIKLFAQLSLRTPGIPPQLTDRLDVILSEAESAASLVEQILDFSRQAPIERRPIDLLSLLTDQVQLLQRTLPEHIEIDLIADERDYTVQADATRVQQAVTNLALNARDAMEQGGHLRIALRYLAAAQSDAGAGLRCVTCGPVTRGKWVEVAVTDTGTGIAPDVLPHLFEPFFTTRGPVGHGLGLAQVYGIVKQHGGHIDVETELGQGATFRLYWPALPSSSGGRLELPEPVTAG